MGDIKKRWYVVRAVSGKEKKVKEYLDLEISRLKLNDFVDQVLIPTEKVFQIRNGKIVSKERAYLPGYVLIEAALDGELEHVIKGTGDIGIELDTDSISMMPVSAFTNCGISVQSAEQFVYQLARLPRSRYLHLAEAAPAQHPAGLSAGLNEAGQVLCALVFAFIQGKQHQAQAI